MTKQFMDAGQVAEHLGVSRQTIYDIRLKQPNRMPAPDVQIGETYYGWSKRTIDTWKDAPRPRSNKRSGRVVA